MDISGAVLRRCMICADVGLQKEAGVGPSTFSAAVGFRRRKGHSRRAVAVAGGGSRRFSDEGHLRYYVVPARCGKKDEEKKRAKLVKGLSRDLSALCATGISFDSPGEVKGNSISETAEILLAQLEHLRCQEKEMKKRKKEAKAAEAKMKSCNASDESSSSSSESSDSECGEVIQMSNLGALSAPDAKLRNVSLPSVEPVCGEGEQPMSEGIHQGIIELEDCKGASTGKILSDNCCSSNSLVTMDGINGCNEDESSSSSSESSDSECEEVQNMRRSRSEPTAVVSDTEVTSEKLYVAHNSGADQQTVERLRGDKMIMKLDCQGAGTPSTSSNSVTAVPMDKVEVCMGGKCKRSGASELMAEFERRIGMEGAVVGCKCMGKCKQGPNVGVLTQFEVNEVSKNPLCIGVGMEDVGTIVSNFFGDKNGLGGLMAA